MPKHETLDEYKSGDVKRFKTEKGKTYRVAFLSPDMVSTINHFILNPSGEKGGRAIVCHGTSAKERRNFEEYFIEGFDCCERFYDNDKKKSTSKLKFGFVVGQYIGVNEKGNFPDPKRPSGSLEVKIYTSQDSRFIKKLVDKCDSLIADAAGEGVTLTRGEVMIAHDWIFSVENNEFKEIELTSKAVSAWSSFSEEVKEEIMADTRGCVAMLNSENYLAQNYTLEEYTREVVEAGSPASQADDAPPKNVSKILDDDDPFA